MKINELLFESAGKMVRGMLVQTLDQFVKDPESPKTNSSQNSNSELDEELGPNQHPVIFHPPIKAQYNPTTQPNQTNPNIDSKERDTYSKVISPNEVAQIVHDKNTYVIYYVDPKTSVERRITTEPIYIRAEKIKEVVDNVTAELDQKFPEATPKVKKVKAYPLIVRTLQNIAIEEAIKNSTEVKFAIKKGTVLPEKLKAKTFTTGANRVRKPNIHKSSVPIIDEATGQIIYDLDDFANRITARPEKILKVNAKMAKSSGDFIRVANIGIPAMNSLVVDEVTKEFRVVNTCPGAGVCKNYCYAGEGGYVQYKAGSESPTRTLNFWYNHPNEFKLQVIAEVKAMIKPGVTVYLRWHDSGDFFTDAYLQVAYDVARAIPEVTIYAYTKIAKVAKDPNSPSNFVINFSDGAMAGETKLIDYKKDKHSIVVPPESFRSQKDTGIGLEALQARNPTAQARMKQVIAKNYDVKVESILTYDEMMDTPISSAMGKYNVIVVPSLDGDLSAARRDVLGSYLLYH